MARCWLACAWLAVLPGTALRANHEDERKVPPFEMQTGSLEFRHQNLTDLALESITEPEDTLVWDSNLRFYDPNVWRKLQHSSRYSWRWKKHRAPGNVQAPSKSTPTSIIYPAQKAASAKGFDWCFFLVVLAFMLMLHVVRFHYPGLVISHPCASLVFLAFGGAFCAVIFLRKGEADGVQWLTGYILEVMNIVENFFVFYAMSKAFCLPRPHLRTAILALMWNQILFDTIFFMGVADWLREFRFLPYVLGVWLIYVAYINAVMGIATPQYPHPCDTGVGHWLTHRLGDRFWPSYDDNGHIFVVKGEKLRVSLLGPVLACYVLAGIFLELDVVVTKLEELPNMYLSYTSSVIGSCVLFEVFFVVEQHTEGFPLFRYGLAFIIGVLGVEMLLNEIYMVPVLANCVLIVVVIIVCGLLSAFTALGTPPTEEAAGPEEVPESAAEFCHEAPCVPGSSEEPPPQEGS